MIASTILTNAKAELVKRGVNRDGWYVNREGTGCVCSIGAIRLATGGELVVDEYEETAWDEDSKQDIVVQKTDYNVVRNDISDEDTATIYLDKALGERPDAHSYTFYSYRVSVPAFNDRTTTDEEVFALFDRAIELAKEAEGVLAV